MLASIPIEEFDTTPTVHFDYDDAFGRSRRGVVIHHDGDFFAFRNLCPHWSTPLDEDGPGLFDPATSELVCQTHGARFELTTGRCTTGPCRGQSLESLSVDVDDEDNRVVIRRGELKFG